MVTLWLNLFQNCMRIFSNFDDFFDENLIMMIINFLISQPQTALILEIISYASTLFQGRAIREIRIFGFEIRQSFELAGYLIEYTCEPMKAQQKTWQAPSAPILQDSPSSKRQKSNKSRKGKRLRQFSSQKEEIGILVLNNPVYFA